MAIDNKNTVPNAPSKGNVPALRFPEFSGEWEDTSLDNECTINPISDKLETEFVYVDLESVEKGELTKMQVIEKGNAPSRAQRVLRNGDILFQCVRPYQKNNYLVRNVASEIQWVASTGYAQLRTDRNNPAFIYHLINTSSFNKKVIVRCTGSSYPAINSDDLSKIHFYICGIEEQKRIADFLSLLDERISIQSRIIEKYETLIKGIVEKILVSTQSIPLHHYSPIITSGKDKNNEGNYPLYGSTGIIGTVSNPSYNKTVVLVARVGSVGNVQYVTEPCGISDNTLIIDAGEDNRFMYYFLKNYKFIHITSGTTQPLITASSLKKIEVPMIDKQERNKIVTILNAIEYKLNNEKMIASLLYRQKNFLLSQMFI